MSHPSFKLAVSQMEVETVNICANFVSWICPTSTAHLQHVILITCNQSFMKVEGLLVPADVKSAHRVSVGKDPVILKLSARCRREVSSMPCLFNHETISRFYIRGGPGERSRFGDSPWAGRSRDQIQVGARFSALVHTGPEFLGTGSISWG
jgi:hypothetical protein